MDDPQVIQFLIDKVAEVLGERAATALVVIGAFALFVFCAWVITHFGFAIIKSLLAPVYAIVRPYVAQAGLSSKVRPALQSLNVNAFTFELVLKVTLALFIFVAGLSILGSRVPWYLTVASIGIFVLAVLTTPLRRMRRGSIETPEASIEVTEFNTKKQEVSTPTDSVLSTFVNQLKGTITRLQHNCRGSTYDSAWSLTKDILTFSVFQPVQSQYYDGTAIQRWKQVQRLLEHCFEKLFHDVEALKISVDSLSNNPNFQELQSTCHQFTRYFRQYQELVTELVEISQSISTATATLLGERSDRFRVLNNDYNRLMDMTTNLIDAVPANLVNSTLRLPNEDEVEKLSLTN